MSSTQFIRKIPNTKVLRDFLVNTGGYFVPGMRDLTAKFCRVTNIFLVRFLGHIGWKEEAFEVCLSKLGYVSA